MATVTQRYKWMTDELRKEFGISRILSRENTYGLGLEIAYVDIDKGICQIYHVERADKVESDKINSINGEKKSVYRITYSVNRLSEKNRKQALEEIIEGIKSLIKA